MRFDEKLEKPLSSDIRIAIYPTIAIGHIKFSDPALTQLEISTTSEIEKGIAYSVAIANVKDCAGNVIQEESNASFGMPEKPIV